jgi:hypothetical protein
MDSIILPGSWKPSVKNRELLNYAMSKIKSVPYPVSGRWVFYQVVQEGLIDKKDVGRFDTLTARARKSFWGDWAPNTLEDTIRHCNFRGEHHCFFDLKFDTITEQPYYVQLWFEAQAMAKQFEYYTKDYRVSLVPFRGDCSIPIKWEIAKKLEAIASRYKKPIQILYFGDYDLKGLQIYESAVNYIRLWCNVDFNVERVGLTREQAQQFNIPENPKKPHTYQWEALNDAQAGKLIINAVEKFITKPSEELLEREAEIREGCVGVLSEFLKGAEK